jgi:hypothetical protein
MRTQSAICGCGCVTLSLAREGRAHFCYCDVCLQLFLLDVLCVLCVFVYVMCYVFARCQRAQCAEYCLSVCNHRLPPDGLFV